MGCKMSRRRTRKQKQEEVATDHQQQATTVSNIIPAAQQAPEINISTLKRAQLQKLCKKHKLKANGKNTELVSRLESHFKEIQQQNLLSNNNSTVTSSPSSSASGNDTNSASPDSIQLQCTENPSQEEKDCPNKWCVVEGTYMKTEDEVHWREIVLSGGRPMVSNRFGKLIPFVLEPSITKVPTNVRDNLICGNCVRKNEEVRSKDFCRTRQQGHSTRNQEKENISFFTKNQSSPVKRKRLEPDLASLKRQRKEPTSSQTLTPANPEVRQSRAKVTHPWKPARRGSTPLTFQEDPEFAKRVEAIISSTVPGSLEERDLVMKATKSPVQHSPTKV